MANNPLYYRSTHEGIFSRLTQLNMIWNLFTLHFNRTIVVYPTPSKHIPDESFLYLNELYQLPDSILFPAPDSSLITEASKLCNFTLGGFYDSELSPMKDMKWHPNTLTCFDGFVYTPLSSTNIPKEERDRWVQMVSNRKPFDGIHRKYIPYLPVLLKSLSINDQNYVVFHWRRGDRLKIDEHEVLSMKCVFNIEDSTSPSCISAESFVEYCQEKLSSHSHLQRLPVYIATNELNKTALAVLKKAGFLTMSDILTSSTVSRDQLSEIFHGRLTLYPQLIMEILLICNAKALFAEVLSEMYGFFVSCRKNDESSTFQKESFIKYRPGPRNWSNYNQSLEVPTKRFTFRRNNHKQHHRKNHA